MIPDNEVIIRTQRDGSIVVTENNRIIYEIDARFAQELRDPNSDVHKHLLKMVESQLNE